MVSMVSMASTARLTACVFATTVRATVARIILAVQELEPSFGGGAVEALEVLACLEGLRSEPEVHAFMLMLTCTLMHTHAHSCALMHAHAGAS